MSVFPRLGVFKDSNDPSMATSKVFLYNLPSMVPRDRILALCECAGSVVHLDLRDGYALITYANDVSADCAVRNLADKTIWGRLLTCKIATSAQARRQTTVHTRKRKATG